jgi:hypothetical protein
MTVRTGVRVSFDSAYEVVLRGNGTGDEENDPDYDEYHGEEGYYEDDDDEDELRELVACHASLCQSARVTRDEVSRFNDLYQSYASTKGKWFGETLLYMVLEHICGDVLVMTDKTEWIFLQDPATEGKGGNVLRLEIELLSDYIDKCYYQIQTGEYLMARGPSVTERFRGVPAQVRAVAASVKKTCLRIGRAFRLIANDPDETPSG